MAKLFCLPGIECAFGCTECNNGFIFKWKPGKMCFGSAENAKIGCKERRAKGKQKSGHQHGTVPQKTKNFWGTVPCWDITLCFSLKLVSGLFQQFQHLFIAVATDDVTFV